MGKEHRRLLNGENPYQIPSSMFSNIYSNRDSLSIDSFEQLFGESPCYTNIADMDCILNTMCKLATAFNKNLNEVPYITIAAKHGNPCGVAVDWNNPDVSIENALWGNPLAIWGGEVITNFDIDVRLAKILYSSPKRKEIFGNANWMLDLVITSGFSNEAVDILGRRKQRKLLANKTLKNPFLQNNEWVYREIRGGFLRQPPPNYILDLNDIGIERKLLSENDIDSVLIAWAVSYTSNHGGNEVALAKDRQLIGVGGGPSTIDAVKVSVLRAKENNFDIKGSVFCADAFFPYIDAPKILIDEGCIGGVVPSGGKRHDELRRYFGENKLVVGFIPEKYRGFCRH
jgi:AICAR transformylase/IMP cyclohydrolase PurH